jgi:hypothetical protein
MSIEIKELNIKTELVNRSDKCFDKDFVFEMENRIVRKIMSEFDDMKKRKDRLLFER